jgi:uncharacterized protein YecE (DUF72 family)
MTVHMGTSGWSYAHWQGVLYPHGPPPRDHLASYLRWYCTIERNSRYNRWPSDAAFRAWRCRLPDGCWLRGQAPRWLTHVQAVCRASTAVPLAAARAADRLVPHPWRANCPAGCDAIAGVSCHAPLDVGGLHP